MITSLSAGVFVGSVSRKQILNLSRETLLTRDLEMDEKLNVAEHKNKSYLSSDSSSVLLSPVMTNQK